MNYEFNKIGNPGYVTRGSGADVGFKLLGDAAVTILALPFAIFGSGCTPAPEPYKENPEKLCSECHTSPSDFPLDSFSMYGEEKIDSHKFHFNPRYSSPVSCFECHNDVENDPSAYITHINRDAAVVVDGFDPQDMSCLVYCHGETKMFWEVDYTDPTLTCVSCHVETDPKHDITDLNECFKCHDQVIDSSGEIISKELHVNGEIDVTQNLCGACHESKPGWHIEGVEDETVQQMIWGCENCHPPVDSVFRKSEDDTHRNGDVSFAEYVCGNCHQEAPDSGGHIKHLNSEIVAKPFECAICHDAPEVGPELLEHLKDSSGLTIDFSGLKFDYPTPAEPIYDAAFKKCSSIYCHGEGLPEGQINENLVWDLATGETASCTSCHGEPPSSQVTIHDPEDSNCDICHPEGFNSHINGVIDLK